jgi:hypothetical protein
MPSFPCGLRGPVIASWTYDALARGNGVAPRSGRIVGNSNKGMGPLAG